MVYDLLNFVLPPKSDDLLPRICWYICLSKFLKKENLFAKAFCSVTRSCVYEGRQGKNSSAWTDQKIKSFSIGAQIRPSSSLRLSHQEVCYKCFLSVQSVLVIYTATCSHLQVAIHC